MAWSGFCVESQVAGDGVPLAWRDFQIAWPPAGIIRLSHLPPRRAAVAAYFVPRRKTWMKGEQTLSVNPGSRSDEAELAWVLAQVAQPHLDAVECHDIYMESVWARLSRRFPFLSPLLSINESCLRPTLSTGSSSG